MLLPLKNFYNYNMTSASIYFLGKSISKSGEPTAKKSVAKK